MKNACLVCGSLAFDNIMIFHDRFAKHILPDQIHILNVSFMVDEVRREFGGCAGNIAYNLHLLGDQPLIMATLGHDGQLYIDRLQSLGLDTNYVKPLEKYLTAQAYIMTDIDDNQIAAFHPGAMKQAHLNRISDIQKNSGSLPVIAIISPDGTLATYEHATDLKAAGIPFIFDPGQNIHTFSGDHLTNLLHLADYCAVNGYEMKLMCEMTGQSLEQLANKVKALFLTLGAEGSRIYANNKVMTIPAVKNCAIVDPTGCGDAYRAGLIYGLSRDWPLLKTGYLASLMGALKISSKGGQTHFYTREAISHQFHTHFQQTLSAG